MVEGPGVHRVAIAHRRLLLNRIYEASSPNGKFTEGAAAINGWFLSHIEAHGKNIFYFFTQSELDLAALEALPQDVVVVHIHFGMSGSFRTSSFPGPESRPATRLRLVNEKEGIVAHLSANLCKHGDIELYRKRIESLGPDPLRKDADKEVFWESLQRSRKTIGAILMDQSVISGIGNIYRTELLFVVGIHPDHPASSLTRATFELVWSEARRLLCDGVATGSIITVSPDEAGKPFSKLRKGEKRYIYNQKNCRRCHHKVHSWKSAQRTVYACEACQPLSCVSAQEMQIMSEVVLPNGKKKIRTTSIDPSNEAELDVTGTQPSLLHNNRKRTGKLQKGRIVEHQAFKDITTGGLLNLGSLEDVFLQGLAPTTPEKVMSTERSTKVRKI